MRRCGLGLSDQTKKSGLGLLNFESQVASFFKVNGQYNANDLWVPYLNDYTHIFRNCHKDTNLSPIEDFYY